MVRDDPRGGPGGRPSWQSLARLHAASVRRAKSKYYLKLVDRSSSNILRRIKPLVLTCLHVLNVSFSPRNQPIKVHTTVIRTSIKASSVACVPNWRQLGVTWVYLLLPDNLSYPTCLSCELTDWFIKKKSCRCFLILSAVVVSLFCRQCKRHKTSPPLQSSHQ